MGGEDDTNKAYGMEQSVNMLSKSIGKNFTSLPDYNYGKHNPAQYSFPMDSRFKQPRKDIEMPGPNVYFYDKEDHYNKYRLDNLG